MRDPLLMDANTSRDADAAEMAALYRAADDRGREFAAHMDKTVFALV